VTLNELDDILKITCPHELQDKNIEHILRKFASLQNRILIDYKRFRSAITEHPLYSNENLEFSQQKEQLKQLEQRRELGTLHSSTDLANTESRNCLLGSHSADPIKEPLRLRPVKPTTPLDSSPVYVGRQQHKLRSTSSAAQYAPCKPLGPVDPREQPNATQIINAKH